MPRSKSCWCSVGGGGGEVCTAAGGVGVEHKNDSDNCDKFFLSGNITSGTSCTAQF